MSEVKERTMRVRIAVAVHDKDLWSAAGGSGIDSVAIALEDVGDDARLTWVEADVPLPVRSPVGTVEGRVAGGDEG